MLVFVLGALLGPAGALDAPVGTLAEVLVPSVGWSVAPPSGSVVESDGCGCHPCQPPVSDGDGDGSSVDDVLGVAVGVVDWSGAEDEVDGDTERRGLAALGLQVADGPEL